MLKFGKLMLVASMLLFAGVVSAQSLRTSYFLDGSLQRYRLNPAWGAERGFVAIPFAGGFNINTYGDVGYGDFVFEQANGGKDLLFTDFRVSADEFLNGLNNDNKVRLDLDMSIISFGFKGWGGFNTFDVSLRSNVGLNIPREMFRAVKTATGDLEFNSIEDLKSIGSYHIKDLNVYTRNFVDISLGHSRKINDNLAIGARVKFLLGLAYANLDFSQIDMNVIDENIRQTQDANGNYVYAADCWNVSSHGRVEAALGGHFNVKGVEDFAPGKYREGVINGYEAVDYKIQGYGAGIDLGATYSFSNFLKGLTLSASVTDLGFIRWNNTATAASDIEYEFHGFTVSQEQIKDGIQNGDYDVVEKSVNSQFEDLQEELESFLEAKDEGEKSVSTNLGAKLNLGVEYTLPFFKKLSVGALYTHCFDDVFKYNKTSIMVNFAPFKIFDVAVSSTFSDFGSGFGALASLHLKYLDLFVGTDCFFSNVNDDYIPVDNMNASVALGVNIALGR